MLETPRNARIAGGADAAVGRLTDQVHEVVADDALESCVGPDVAGGAVIDEKNVDRGGQLRQQPVKALGPRLRANRGGLDGWLPTGAEAVDVGVPQ